MKHYANPITGRHKVAPESPAKYNASLAMGEGAMRAAGAVKPIAYSSTEQAAEPAAGAADNSDGASLSTKVDLGFLETELENSDMEEIDTDLDEEIQLLPK